MDEIIDALVEFHRTYGQDVGTKFDETRNPLLRYKLMREENEEYLDACLVGSTTDILDALVDEMYILAGTMVAHGLDTEMFMEAFREVHRSNMSKLDADGKPIYREDGKVLKGPNFFEPDLKSIIDKFEKEAADV